MTENQSVVINLLYDEPMRYWRTFWHAWVEFVYEWRRAVCFGKTDETLEKLEFVNLLFFGQRVNCGKIVLIRRGDGQKTMNCGKIS